MVFTLSGLSTITSTTGKLARTLSTGVVLGALMLQAAAVWAAPAQGLGQIDFWTDANSTRILLHSEGRVSSQLVESTPNKVVVDLKDVIPGDAIRTDFSNAPNIERVMMQPKGPNQIRLIIHGHHLTSPSVAFIGNNAPLNQTLAAARSVVEESDTDSSIYAPKVESQPESSQGITALSMAETGGADIAEKPVKNAEKTAKNPEKTIKKQQKTTENEAISDEKPPENAADAVETIDISDTDAAADLSGEGEDGIPLDTLWKTEESVETLSAGDMDNVLGQPATLGAPQAPKMASQSWIDQLGTVVQDQILWGMGGLLAILILGAGMWFKTRNIGKARSTKRRSPNAKKAKNSSGRTKTASRQRGRQQPARRQGNALQERTEVSSAHGSAILDDLLSQSRAIPRAGGAQALAQYSKAGGARGNRARAAQKRLMDGPGQSAPEQRTSPKAKGNALEQMVDQILTQQNRQTTIRPQQGNSQGEGHVGPSSQTLERMRRAAAKNNGQPPQRQPQPIQRDDQGRDIRTPNFPQVNRAGQPQTPLKTGRRPAAMMAAQGNPNPEPGLTNNPKVLDFLKEMAGHMEENGQGTAAHRVKRSLEQY